MTNPSQGITGTCSVPMLAQENDWICMITSQSPGHSPPFQRSWAGGGRSGVGRSQGSGRRELRLSPTPVPRKDWLYKELSLAAEFYLHWD